MMGYWFLETNRLWPIHLNFTYHEAREFCHNIGGTIPKILTKAELDNLLQGDTTGQCKDRGTWLPIIQRAQNQPDLSPGFQMDYTYDWIHDYYNEKMTSNDHNVERAAYLPFEIGKPNGYHLKQCLVANRTTKRLEGKLIWTFREKSKISLTSSISDEKCDSPRHCFLCESPYASFFELKGLSPLIKEDIGTVFWLDAEDLPYTKNLVTFYGANKLDLIWEKGKHIGIPEKLFFLPRHEGLSDNTPFGLHQATLVGTNETMMVKFTRVSIIISV